jgi:uncharacterized protein (UPF0332 family)
VTPEAERFLGKARKHLGRARVMLSVDLHEDAGRAAYLASFHAAQALLFERLGKVFKTHKGVQAEFFHLTKDDPRLGPELRVFLSQAYNLKAIADYEEGEDSPMFAERVVAAVDTASRFVEGVAGLLGEGA